MKSTGLFNTVCQDVVETRYCGKVHSISTPNGFEKVIGDELYFADRYGYSPEKIVERLKCL